MDLYRLMVGFFFFFFFFLFLLMGPRGSSKSSVTNRLP